MTSGPFNPGQRLLFVDCVCIKETTFDRELPMGKTVKQYRQVFRTKSVKALLVHSGARVPTGDGKTPFDMKGTVKRWDMQMLRILRPRIVKKDDRLLTLF